MNSKNSLGTSSRKAAVKKTLNAIAACVKENGASALAVAWIARNMEDSLESDSHDRDAIIELAFRIDFLCQSSTDTRFSSYDYTDAVCNMTKAVDIKKLLALDECAFETAMIGLAQYKRETYSSDAPIEHKDTTVLSLDIYKD